MPELPEVETTRQGIRPHILNKTITRVDIRQPQLRWPVPSMTPLMAGAAILEVGRRSKYLSLHLEKGVVLIHLGMSGRLSVFPHSQAFDKHDHVDFVLSDNTLLRYTDPRRFGSIVWTTEALGTHPLLVHLGPEPLTAEFNADYLFDRSRMRKIPLKTFIMTANIVVGVGNIYANEALFRARLHPLRLAASLTRPETETLVLAIQDILAEAIRQGGTTLRDFLSPSGKQGYFAQDLKVYGRAGHNCTACQSPLQLIRLQNRSTVFCPCCQT